MITGLQCVSSQWSKLLILALKMHQNLHMCRCKHLFTLCWYSWTPLLIYRPICWIFYSSLHLILSKQMKSWWTLKSPRAASLPSAALILNLQSCTSVQHSCLGVINYIHRATVYLPQFCPTSYDHYTTFMESFLYDGFRNLIVCRAKLFLGCSYELQLKDNPSA